MPTSPVSPQIALARSLSEQERRRRQAAEAQVRPRLNDPILRKFLPVLFSVVVDDPCQAALKIVGGALQASLAWAETSAMSAQLQELQHEIVSPVALWQLCNPAWIDMDAACRRGMTS